MLSEGAGGGGQPEPHAAEADGRARLHHGSLDGLPPNSGQLRGRAVPENVRYSGTAPGPVSMLSGVQRSLIFVLCVVFLSLKGNL